MKKIILAFVAAVIIVPAAYVFLARPGQQKAAPAVVPEIWRPVIASADGGDNKSQYKTGKAYFYGEEGLEKNLDKGFFYMKKAADGGNVDANFEMGYAYKFGKGTPTDLKAAVANFTKAADAGNSTAMLEIAKIFDGAKRPDLAAPWYEKAANAGEQEAVKKMADVSCAVPKPEKACVDWLKKAADINSVDHIKKLAQIYKDGTIVPQSNQKALDLYMKAAGLGDLDSTAAIGYAYSTGSLGARDNKLAYEWTLKAAQAGNVDSMYNLGLMLQEGKIVKQNVDDALSWYLMAAGKNNNAAYNAGLIYARRQEFTDAVPLLTTAAKSQMKGAAGILAYTLLQTRDYTNALAWANRGSDAGDPLAMYVLGALYSNGYGVDQDTEQGFNWYTQALNADPKNSFYMYALAESFALKGEYAKSVYWLQQAAQNGSKRAMQQLAVLYKEGRGVKKDPVTAASWQKAAAKAKDDAVIF